MRTLLLVTVATLLLAGCAGKDKASQTAPPGSEPTETGLPPGVTNILEGTVQALDAGPLSDVMIKLDDSNETRTTDAAGYYRFENLLPQDYIVFATLDGYKPKTQRAVVEDDRAFQLDFLLEPIPLARPYNETTPKTGLIECQIHYQTNEDNPNRPTCGPGVDPNNSPTRIFTIGAGAAQIVIEMVWTPRTSAASHLTLTAIEPESGTEVAYVHSASTLKVTISENIVRKFYAQGGELRTLVEAGPSITGDEAAADVGLAFQQDYTIHLTVFYHEIGPPTFTALEE